MQLIGVDTGGTFTDAVVITDDGRVAVGKALSTPRRLEAGVLDAVAAVATRLGTDADTLLAGTDLIGHGTTVGLNALLTGDVARVGLITTSGFESTLAIAKANKVHGLPDEQLRSPVSWDKPPRLVPRHLVRGVTERVDAAGRVLCPLDEEQARATVDGLLAAGVESLAVALLFSPVNPAHEQRLREIVRERAPECHVSLSAELAPRIGEYERTSTVVLDAAIAPLVTSYLSRLEKELAGRGFTGTLVLTRMAGGVHSVAEARRAPIQTLRSGPAGGVAAVQKLGAARGQRNVIATDVGGTSFDVGLVIDGAPLAARQPMVDRYALAMPLVDITSIGTGGGSIAWVDPAMGALRVGPRSAGADPGPACYGRGGTAPTLTDAAVVLGYVERLGGTLALDPQAAADAIERAVAGPLGLSVPAAAEGIVQVACAQMHDLVRRTTVQRGHDPADFALYVYGGAGPQYAGRYADGLGVTEVVVPALAAQLSAFGAVANDVRASAEQDLPPAPLDRAAERVRALADRLAGRVSDQARAFDRHPAGGADAVRVQRAVGLRFYRQLHRIDVPLPDGPLDRAAVAGLLHAFRDRYERVVGPGSAHRDTPVEAVAVTAEAVLPAPPLRATRPAGRPGPARGTRPAYFGGERITCPVHAWEELAAGQRVDGPAFVESVSTTVVVHPHQAAVADERGDLRLDLGPAR